jgi:hypothetical protein
VRRTLGKAISWAIDKAGAISESQKQAAPGAVSIVQIKIDLPDDLFDEQFTEPDFTARIRELAILDLVRIKRMHEHEAQRMLGIERWELVQRMLAAGITPTEKAFEEIKGELGRAIAGRNRGRKS